MGRIIPYMTWKSKKSMVPNHQPVMFVYQRLLRPWFLKKNPAQSSLNPPNPRAEIRNNRAFEVHPWRSKVLARRSTNGHLQEKNGKILRKYGKMLGKCWTNDGKMLEKWWENAGKMMGKWWKNDGNWWKLMEKWWKLMEKCRGNDGNLLKHAGKMMETPFERLEFEALL